MSRADQFEPLDPDKVDLWRGYGNWDREYFPQYVGFSVEEIRRDYCRMRLPFRPVHEQPAGVVHGGVLAALMDSVVVPAIGSGYAQQTNFSTIELKVQYLDAVREEDMVAEGWIVKRGRSIIFCEAEVCASPSGRVVARGQLTFKVSANPAQ